MRQGLAASGTLQGMRIEIISPDVRLYNWLGGTTILKGQLRVQPCDMTRRSAAIDYRGKLKMCCNVFPEATDHRAYVIGDLNESSFGELWESESMQRYRVAHSVGDWTLSPICVRCTQSLPDTSAESTCQTASTQS